MKTLKISITILLTTLSLGTFAQALMPEITHTSETLDTYSTPQSSEFPESKDMKKIRNSNVACNEVKCYDMRNENQGIRQRKAQRNIKKNGDS